MASESWNHVYWRKSQKVKNYGDYLGHYFLLKAGVPLSPYGTNCLTIGTTIAQFWWDRCLGPIEIWGAGSSGFSFPKLNTEDRFHAVRGPLTRDWLKLPESTPTGDPALLLPRLYQPSPEVLEKASSRPTNYFYTANFNPPQVREEVFYTFSRMATRQEGSTFIREHQVESFTDKIVSANFVWTSSLHAAVVAQAYGRPWAIRNEFEHNTMPLRWLDWLTSLALPVEAMRYTDSPEEGFRWWEEWGPEIVLPDLDALVDSCPFSELKDRLTQEKPSHETT